MIKTYLQADGARTFDAPGEAIDQVLAPIMLNDCRSFCRNSGYLVP